MRNMETTKLTSLISIIICSRRFINTSMVDDKLDSLLQTTGSTTMSLEQLRKFNNTKRKINGICKAATICIHNFCALIAC